MGNFFDKLSIYDQLGYIMVGLYAMGLTGVFLAIYGQFNTEYFFSISGSDNFILVILIMIVVGFILGHLIQSLASFMREIITNLSVNEVKSIQPKQTIYEEARKYFQLSKDEPLGSIFHYCYLYTLWYDRSGQVRTFMSLNIFYKGLLAATSMALFGGLTLVLVELLLISMNGQVPISVIGLVLYVGCLGLFSIILWYRMNQFYQLATEKTLITFHLLLHSYIEKK
jgi:hypothetical protein